MGPLKSVTPHCHQQTTSERGVAGWMQSAHQIQEGPGRRLRAEGWKGQDATCLQMQAGGGGGGGCVLPEEAGEGGSGEETELPGPSDAGSPPMRGSLPRGSCPGYVHVQRSMR